MKEDLRSPKPLLQCYPIDRCVDIHNSAPRWYWRPRNYFLNLPCNLQHLTQKDNLGLKRTIKYWGRDSIQKIKRMAIDKMPFFSAMNISPYSEYQTDHIRLIDIIIKWKKKKKIIKDIWMYFSCCCCMTVGICHRS